MYLPTKNYIVIKRVLRAQPKSIFPNSYCQCLNYKSANSSALNSTKLSTRKGHQANIFNKIIIIHVSLRLLSLFASQNDTRTGLGGGILNKTTKINRIAYKNVLCEHWKRFSKLRRRWRSLAMLRVFEASKECHRAETVVNLIFIWEYFFGGSRKLWSRSSSVLSYTSK